MKYLLLLIAMVITLFTINTIKKNPTTYIPTIVPTVQVTDKNAKTLEGTVIMSPNKGEGLSFQFAENNNGQTYHPFWPLRNNTPDKDFKSQIVNKKRISMSINDLQVGDVLKTVVTSGPCIMGVKGGWSGCILKYYYIQDLSR